MNEGLFNILKPKSKDEIDSIIQEKIENLPTLVDFIYENGINDVFQTLKQYDKVAKLLKTPPNEVFVIDRSNDLYEVISKNVTNDFHERIGGKFLKKLDFPTGPHRYGEVFQRFAYFSTMTKHCFMMSMKNLIRMLMQSN